MALTMSSMHLRVIQQRRRWDLAWWDFAQKLGIAFEQSVDGLGHLVGHAPRSPASWPCRTACARHRGTWLDQPVVELGPFIVPQPDGLEDGEKQHLLHVYETRHLHHCQIICGNPLSVPEVRRLLHAVSQAESSLLSEINVPAFTITAPATPALSYPRSPSRCGCHPATMPLSIQVRNARDRWKHARHWLHPTPARLYRLFRYRYSRFQKRSVCHLMTTPPPTQHQHARDR